VIGDGVGSSLGRNVLGLSVGSKLGSGVFLTNGFLLSVGLVGKGVPADVNDPEGIEGDDGCEATTTELPEAS